MENEEKSIVERLEAATTLLERTLSWLEERQGALSGEVEKISATVEQSRRETELAEKLAAVERELAEVKAAPRKRAEPSAPDHASGHGGDAGQARHRRGAGGCARAGCGVVGPEPGTAHRGEDATAAGRRDCVKAVVSGQ